MLTEVRVDEGVQRRSQQKAAEKGAGHVGLAESVRGWVQHLLDHNDTDVELVRHRARPPPRPALRPSRGCVQPGACRRPPPVVLVRGGARLSARLPTPHQRPAQPGWWGPFALSRGGSSRRRWCLLHALPRIAGARPRARA